MGKTLESKVIVVKRGPGLYVVVTQGRNGCWYDGSSFGTRKAAEAYAVEARRLLADWEGNK